MELTRTLSNDLVMLDDEHFCWDQHVLHLLQELWPEAGDGDLLWGHEGGEAGVHAASIVGHTGKHQRDSQGGGGALRHHWNDRA